MSEKTVSPFEKLVKIQLPREAKGDENYVFVSVNGRGFKIMKGVEVEVPEPVEEVLRHSNEMQQEAERYATSTPTF